MNTHFVHYGHSVRTKQYTKHPNAKHAVKAEISMKTILFSDSAKRSAFSTGLRPNDATSVCLWLHREHGDGKKRLRQRRFVPSQDVCVKNMINGNLSSELILLLFTSVYGAASSIQNCASSLVLRLQKCKNCISARRTYLQHHIRSPITQNGSDNFSSGKSGKWSKIATPNDIFSRQLTESSRHCAW